MNDVFIPKKYIIILLKGGGRSKTKVFFDQWELRIAARNTKQILSYSGILLHPYQFYKYVHHLSMVRSNALRFSCDFYSFFLLFLDVKLGKVNFGLIISVV